MIPAIGIMLGFYVMMQAGVSYEVGRDKGSAGLKFLSSVTMLVAFIVIVSLIL